MLTVSPSLIQETAGSPLLGGFDCTRYCMYLYVHTCTIWPCVVGSEGKALFCWFPCFCDWIIHSSSKNSFIPLCLIPPPLCLPCPFSLTKHNTFSCPLLPPAHLLCPLCPVLAPSSSHILFYPPAVHFDFLYLTLSVFFFTSFSAPLLAIPLVFFSLFNLDFHRTLFCLCGSNSLSFYFFWWQSLIFTSPLSLSHPVSVSVSLHCHGLSLFPLTCSLMLLLY